MEVLEALIVIDKFITENNNYEVIPYHHTMADKDMLVPRFIVECNWTCNTDHIVDKWHEAQGRTDYYGYFTVFFCEMDTENRKAMVKWIMDNRTSRYEQN